MLYKAVCALVLRAERLEKRDKKESERKEREANGGRTHCSLCCLSFSPTRRAECC